MECERACTTVSTNQRRVEMDLSNIYNIQKNYFLRGNTLSVSFRKQQLKKLYEAINRHEDAIVDALKKDLGKSREKRI